jgi:thiol-disulfide isomerase/thioredoxin
MKKVALAISAGLLILIFLVGIGLGSHFFAARRLVALNSVATGGADAGGMSRSNAYSSPVIRFVANPEAMPPFEVRDLDGNRVSTAALAGKVVLLNFWATWCLPCRAEIPEMIDLQSRYKSRLEVIGISLDGHSVEAVKQFARQQGVNYPIVMGNHKLLAAYGGVATLPTTFVVSPEGRVVQKHMGLVAPQGYDLEIRALLKMPVEARIETVADVGQIFAKNATELPDVDMSSLTPEQKKAALQRMDSETCPCGCKFTIAQCRIDDSRCKTSKGVAAKIVKDVASGAPAKTVPRGATEI